MGAPGSIPCTPTLTVQVVGEGTVTSDPAGISCPGDCFQKYAYGTNVTLTASPTPGWQFDGWSDACTGTGSCVVAINRSRSVTATFSTPPPATDNRIQIESLSLSVADVAAIKASRVLFAEAVLAGDGAAVAALFTEDAAVMRPNESVVEGRAVIQASLEPFPSITQFEATIVQMEGRGDLAFVRAAYSMTHIVEGAPEPIHDTGKIVDIWRKQPDGKWLIAVHIFNSDLPLPD